MWIVPATSATVGASGTSTDRPCIDHLRCCRRRPHPCPLAVVNSFAEQRLAPDQRARLLRLLRFSVLLNKPPRKPRTHRLGPVPLAVRQCVLQALRSGGGLQK